MRFLLNQIDQGTWISSLQSCGKKHTEWAQQKVCNQNSLNIPQKLHGELWDIKSINYHRLLDEPTVEEGTCDAHITIKWGQSRVHAEEQGGATNGEHLRFPGLEFSKSFRGFISDSNLQTYSSNVSETLVKLKIKKLHEVVMKQWVLKGEE